MSLLPIPLFFALSLGGDAGREAFPAQEFRVATLFTAQEMRGALASDSGREQAIEWCKRHGVEHAFVESFRDGYEAKEETLVAVRDRFRAAGLMVSGCVTPTNIGKSSNGWKGISCYTAPETRAQLRGIFERAARLFERIMIDDFLFTDCRCPDCEKAKGEASWDEYRLRLMYEVSERDILAPARAVRPDVRVIIKYPQWYDNFHNRGYDVARQTQLFPAIWVGTETRDPDNKYWGRKAQYEAYYIMRWLGGIGADKTGGGWFDPYGTSPATYLEQARQTVLGGAREMLLFCHASLVEPQNARCTEALIPELPSLRELARRIRGARPVGIAAPKPPNSQPAPGEDYIFDFVGMLGLPLVPATGIPEGARAAFISSHSAREASTLAWLRAEERRPVLLTAAAEKALPEEALTVAKRPIARISWSNDPREIMDLPREKLDGIRSDLLRPFGIRFSAPGRVALYLFEPAAGGNESPAEGKPAYCAIENFRDESAEVTAEGLDEREGAEAARIVLPVGSRAEFLRKQRGLYLKIPARGLVVYELARTSFEAKD